MHFKTTTNKEEQCILASLWSESGIYIKTAVGDIPWTLYLINSEGCGARVTEGSVSGTDYAASVRASWSLWPCRRVGHELPREDKEVVCSSQSQSPRALVQDCDFHGRRFLAV